MESALYGDYSFAKKQKKQKKNTGFPRSLTDGYAMLMSPKQLAKQVSRAAIARVIRLCACVR